MKYFLNFGDLFCIEKFPLKANSQFVLIIIIQFFFTTDTTLSLLKIQEEEIKVKFRWDSSWYQIPSSNVCSSLIATSIIFLCFFLLWFSFLIRLSNDFCHLFYHFQPGKKNTHILYGLRLPLSCQSYWHKVTSFCGRLKSYCWLKARKSMSLSFSSWSVC